MTTNTATLEVTTYGIGLSNAWSEENVRLRAAQDLADPATFRHLEAIGIAPSMRCLEVGGGCGSVARYMADRVGPTGSVVVTDLDTRQLEGCDLSNVEALVHDIGADSLDENEFDVIHTRLVLMHLPNRLEVLDKLVRALRPGGWLLIEDFDHSAPSHMPEGRQLFVPRDLGPKYQRVLLAAHALVSASGINLEFGRDLPAHLVRAGLADVDAEACSPLVRGGTTRAAYYALSMRQVRGPVVATGLVSDADVDEVIAALESPGTIMQSTPMVSAWGRHA